MAGRTVQQRPAARPEGHAAEARAAGRSGEAAHDLASAINGTAAVRGLAALSGALNARPAVRQLAGWGGALNARPAALRLAALSGTLQPERGAAQLAAADPPEPSGPPVRGGLPERLKAGVEALSGLAMDDVRVHYDSPRPKQLRAHAFTRGSEIHLAPGQERHLPHEAWHVVQQHSGRVRPTARVAGVDVNDDAALEGEADRMGQRAAQLSAAPLPPAGPPPAGGVAAIQRKPAAAGGAVVQRVTAETIAAVMFQLQDVLKKFQARLTTSLVEESIEGSEADKMWGYLDQARTKLNGLIASRNVRPADGHSFNFDRDAPLYMQGPTLYVTDDFVAERMSLTDQANMLLQLLLPQIPDEDLRDLLRVPKNEPEPDEGEEMSLRSGIKLFRAVKATAARSYILSGIPRISNRDNWTVLGNGFYTSPDREGAEIYSLGLGRPATVIELTLSEEASGKVVKDTKATDGKTEEQIKIALGPYDFLTEPDLSQIKFNNPFYQEHLAIERVWVQDHLLRWTAYTPDLFVRDFEQLRIDQHKRKAAQLPLPLEPEPGPMLITDVEHPTPALTEARDAPPQTIAAIIYIDAAQAFEKRLGAFLASYPPATAEVGDLVAQAWAAFDETQRKKFGYGSADRAGAVGKETGTLQAVVDGGNLRERLTLLYNGYTAKLWGNLARPKELQDSERRDRLSIAEEDRPTAPHPNQVVPELSNREWFTSVDAEGQLSWKSGSMLYHYKMSTPFQKEAEELLTPVSSGISGTSYGILQVAEKYGVDLQLIRLALLGWMLPTGDHTYHEIMSACAMFSSELDYDPGEKRYRHLPPLTQEELRAIAPGKMFPDELAGEPIAFDLLQDAVRQAAAKSAVGAGNLYIEATRALPEKFWTGRLKALGKRIDELLT